jgi:ribonuclease HI
VIRDWRMKRLGKARPPLAAEWAKADLGLTLTRHPRWEEDRIAALRVLQSGGALPQAIAGKWVAGGTTCPHCQLAVETLQHRLWECPAWQRIRSQQLQGRTPAELAASLGQPALLTGIIPLDPLLVRAAEAARQAGVWPPPRPLHTVYTDGSCVHPTDPWLRRAAWAAVGPAPRFEVAACAPVFGDQTIGRAELSALIWAHRCHPVRVVVDAQYLVTALADTGRPGPEQLHGPNGDLWALLVSEVRPSWVKAHLSLAEARHRGFPDDHWQGNEVADRAASTLAQSLLPPPDILAARQRMSSLAAVLQDVISRVQHAAISANRSVRHIARRVHKPLWRRPKRVKAKAPAKPTLPELPAVAGRPVCCQLAALPGPVLSGRCLGVRCVACGRAARTKAQARKLGAALCPGHPDLASARRQPRGNHELQRCSGGWFCMACHLLATPSRRAGAARASCPMPQFWQAARPCPASVQQVRRNWCMLAALFSPKPAAAIAPLVEAPPAAGPPLRWRDHLVLSAPSHAACLRCGAVRVARRRAYLLASPCAGHATAAGTSHLRTMLRAGVFDVALRQATPEAAGLAASLGWRAVSEGGPAAWLDGQRDMAPD